jgi:hypothetical protein
LRRCRCCGFPRKLARTIEWRSDGTVVGSTRIRLPFMFLAVDERDRVFNELSRRIGFPIEHVFVRAQRNVGKELYELVMSMYGNIDARKIPNSRLLRPQWLARLIVRAMRNELACTGIGRVSVDGYRAGEYLVIRVANPSLIPAVVGNMTGIYELAERMPSARAHYSFDGEDLVIRLEHGPAEAGEGQRLYLEEVRVGTGPLSYDRCPGCGVPQRIARALVWDVERGILVNMDSGDREGMVAVQSIVATMRELEAELGGKVTGMLYEAQKDYTRDRLLRRRLPELPDRFWEEYLTDLALRGQGYPREFDYTGDTLSVKIDNAYEQSLYAAKVAAGVEVLTGSDTGIEWSRREGRLGEYVISPIQAL